MPISLTEATIHAVVRIAAAKGSGAGVASSSVAFLIERELRTILMTRIKWAVAAVLVAGGMIAGEGYWPSRRASYRRE